MEDRVVRFRVGVLVVATICLTIILVLIIGETPQFLRGRVTIFIGFSSAPGVTVNTPVRKSGILIGRVTDVQLLDGQLEGQDVRVLVTAAIDAHRRKHVYRSDDVRIRAASLFGDPVLEFVPSPDPEAGREPLEDGDYLLGQPAMDPIEAGREALETMRDAMSVIVKLESDVDDALQSVGAAGVEVAQTARNMNVLIVNNQDQLKRILGTTERALGRFETAMTAVNDIISDEELRIRLRQALDGVPQLLTDAGNLITGLERVAEAAQKNLDNLQGLTGPLGEQGGQLATMLARSVDQLDQLLSELVHVARTINRGEGSLGQFVHNPELYQRLNRVAENIEQLTQQLEPIVHDVRAFTNKIARNPGRLGIQGALSRQESGIK